MKRLSWLYILLMLVGCTESSIEDNSVIATGSEEFYATMEGTDSRTYVDEQIRMRWHADDRITIFKKETYNREFKFTGKTGANAGGFKQVSVDDDFYFGYPVNANYAVYPHSTDTELDETDCFFTLTMPAEQTYAENSFGRNANTMVAVSETGNLMFKNVGCYLRVRLYGENTTISSVTLTTKGDEAIAGEAKVTPSMEGNPTCEMTGTGKSICLICETPVTISSNVDAPTDFWIVVPPVTLADGFSVTVENENGNTQVYDVNQSFTFERNKYYDMVRKLEIEDIKTVHVATAGTLPTLISEDEKYNITSIKITGDLNGTDFKLIREMGGCDLNNNRTDGKLVYLDLSDANIVEGGEAYSYENGEHYTIENTLTPFLFGFCSIQKIIIPNSVTVIGSLSFVLSQITSITIPKSIFQLGYHPFLSCSNLSEIKVDPENTIYDSRENCNAIIETNTNTLVYGNKSTVIPNSVTSIREEAFSNCSNLTNIIIPNSVTSIGEGAFSDCSNLTNITIPNSVTSIGYRTFEYCSNLTNITIPNSVTSIGESAFRNCSNLTNITIPNSVTSIGKSAFEFCSNLTNITIPNSVISIGESAFDFCSKLTNISIPNSVTYLGNSYSDGLEAIYISDIKAWCQIEFSNYSNWLRNGPKLYLNNELVKNVIIPNSITEIKDWAFYGYTFLESVNIPNTVTRIGNHVFCGTSLTDVELPNSVVEIGQSAFHNCFDLTSITIPKSVHRINDQAFMGCI